MGRLSDEPSLSQSWDKMNDAYSGSLEPPPPLQRSLVGRWLQEGPLPALSRVAYYIKNSYTTNYFQ